MTPHRVGASSLVAAALLLNGAISTLRAQDTGTITGRVTAVTGQSLSSAQLSIPGTGIGGLSNEQGRYILLNVPAGQHILRVQLIGYGTLEKTVTVQGGGQVTANFEMQRTALALDEIVVTGAGQATARRQLGNTIESINAEQLEDLPINTASDALQGRTPGVMVRTAGGNTGQGSQIRIRGQGSLSQNNEPIIYVDGVRIVSDAGQGGWRASRLDDINPASIERIEILKGAAAATLYGTEASSGVIQIFTKGGQRGPARWTLQSSVGFSKAMEKQYEPLAGFAMSENPTCGRAYGCDLGTKGIRDYWGIDVAPFEVFSVSLYDPMLEVGRFQEHSLEVSGGSDLLTYHVGGRYNWEDGIVDSKNFGDPETGAYNLEDIHKVYQLDANVSMFPLQNLRLQVTSRYTNRHFTPLDEGQASVVSLNEYGKPEISTFANPMGWTSFMSVRDAMQVMDSEDTDRFGGSLAADYALTPDLHLKLTTGLDVVNEVRTLFYPFDWSVSGTTSRNPDGLRDVRSRFIRDLSFDGSMSWNVDLGDMLSSSLVMGAQALTSDTHVVGSTGQRFPGPGLEVTEAASIQSARESALSTVNLGIFGQEQVGLRDYLFVTLGLRYDRHSAFGADAGGALYPKASISFIPSAFEGWNGIGPVSSVRLRAAIGQSGLQPGAFDAFTTWSPRASELGPGLAPDNLGNPNLAPEVTTEWEGGFELGLFSDRIALETTYWNRTVKDALVARRFQPSGGFINPQLDNIGEVKAHGIDLSIRGTAFQSSRLSIDIFANGAYLREKVTSLGGAPPIRLGSRRILTWVREGFAPSALFGGKLVDAEYPIDIEGNGEVSSRGALLAWFSQPRSVDQVEDRLLGLQAPDELGGGLLNHYLGKATPDWQGSFGTEIRFLDDFTFTSTFSYAAGNYQMTNRLYGFRTSNGALGRNYITDAKIESTLLNPASTAEERLEAAKLFSTRGAALDKFNGINQVQNADNLRWQEASLSYQVPAELAGRFGTDQVTLSSAVRNLMLWTKFGGGNNWDPETGTTQGGGLENGDTSHALAVPRRFTFSIRISF